MLYSHYHHRPLRSKDLTIEVNVPEPILSRACNPGGITHPYFVIPWPKLALSNTNGAKNKETEAEFVATARGDKMVRLLEIKEPTATAIIATSHGTGGMNIKRRTYRVWCLREGMTSQSFHPLQYFAERVVDAASCACGAEGAGLHLAGAVHKNIALACAVAARGGCWPP
jgi:hypothetical protein